MKRRTGPNQGFPQVGQVLVQLLPVAAGKDGEEVGGYPVCEARTDKTYHLMPPPSKENA